MTTKKGRKENKTMASIEFIQNRVAGAEAKVTKLEKKLERILKAKAHDYEDKYNPYFYSDYDLSATEKELSRAKASLEKYKADLQTAQEKAASRNVKVILEFLENWKERMTKFYGETFEAYPKAYEKFTKEVEPLRLGYFEERKLQKENYEEYKRITEERKALEEMFHARFGCVQPYVERAYNPVTQKYDTFRFDWEKFNKDLTEEANRKYDFIIERTNAIVGQITDASALKIGAKGDLNGYIIGTKGTAKVQTIGAGGYNIQCYHFRTLINEMK